MNNLNQNLDNESKHLTINNKIVESVIIKEEFNVFAGTFTICTLTLKNGHEVLGQHTCPDHSEYIEEVSRRLARENACEKIWSLEAYLIKERQSQNNSLQQIKDRILNTLRKCYTNQHQKASAKDFYEELKAEIEDIDAEYFYYSCRCDSCGLKGPVNVCNACGGNLQ